MRLVSCAAFAIAVWCFARPYIGLRHDGILYLGQALMRGQSPALKNDLFFAFGSQDQFSIFSSLVPLLYQWLGVGHTQIVILGVCHLSLVLIAGLLASELPLGARWLGVLAMACMSHFYGGMDVFSFTETFVTARTAAEPLALGGIALVLYRRVAAGFLLQFLALAIHPLIAIPALATSWVMLALRHRQWLWIGCAAIASLLTISVLGVPPFDRLVLIYDPDWMAVISEANQNVFITNWGLVHWQGVILNLVILAAVHSYLPERSALLALAACAATVLLLLLTWIGADALHSVLITQLQLWRVLWVPHLLALLFLPWLLVNVWRSGPAGRLAASSLALTALAVDIGWISALAFGLWAALAWVVWRKSIEVSASLMRVALIATQGAIAVLTTFSAIRLISELSYVGAASNADTVLWVVFRSPAIVFLLVFCFNRLVRQSTERGEFLRLALGLVVAATAIGMWDRRGEWSRFLEDGPERRHPFVSSIPEQAQVFWPDELAAPWALLGRAQYFHAFQGSGLLFSRQTALEFERRRTIVAPLALQKQICGFMAQISTKRKQSVDCDPDIELMIDICEKKGGPDFVVLQTDYGRPVVSRWIYTRLNRSQAYFLHSCPSLIGMRR